MGCMPDDKISTAVEACLVKAIGQTFQHPILQVKAYLDCLRADPEWTDAEVMEVQTNVIGALMARLSRDQIGGPSDKPTQ
jgi:hypothetical protein